MATKSNYLRVLAGLILFLLAGFPAFGSTNSKWFTRVWQIDDGLPDNDVNSIIQGPNEYLWLVTPVGLTRFDGVYFHPLPNIEDFNGPHVRRILCSRTGVLWVAFDGGKITALNPDASIVSLKGKLPPHAPLILADDKSGTLWMGYDDFIYRAQNGQVTKLTAKNGVPSGMFYSLCSDGAGSIWLAKGNQISYFQNEKFHPVADMENVQCMAAAHTNAVWLVANAHLFFCDADGHLQDCGVFQKPTDARVMALLEDHDGAVWIGTHGNGLFRYQSSRFERIETSHSTILSLAEDHEGNLWAGTGGGGLDRITPCGIRLEALKNNQIQSICQDANGILWGATQNGTLVSRDGSNWKPAFTHAPFAGTVTCVTADQSAVWAGTRNGELLRIADDNYTVLETNLAHGFINGLLAANHDLWVVGSDTLQRLHDGRMENIKLPRQVRRICAITEDVAGNVWIGANGILLRFNGTNLINETSHLRISGRPICCLYGTDDGSLWIGSRGGGLMWFKNGHVGQIAMSQGLANDSIAQMVADRQGWIWFGSNDGIFKLREREVERAMENHDLSLRPIIYGKNEGLISQDAVSSLAAPYVFPRAVLSHDGRVWIITHTGVVVADPNTLHASTAPPPVLLTQFIMDGQIINSHDNVITTKIVVGGGKTLNRFLKIPPSHRHLEFDFTAFHFRAPENLHFRYQLVSYDNDWIDAGAERSAAYSRLPAGNYQFRVAASVGDGAWSDPPVSLNFTVVPFFWQTWWFRIGALLIFTLSIIATVRYVSYRRLRLKLRATEQQAAVERERGRIARDIHDDLGNRLTEIQLLAGLAQRNGELPRPAVNSIHEISSAARQATDALDEIVWAINPRNDTLPHLINYLGQFITDFMRTAGIQCRVDLPENPPAKSVPAEVRHNLFLAIKESLNNIVRHANATEVLVVILATDKSLSVIIEDNGRGFSGETKGDEADGLENMRRRIAEIGGQFQIKSQPGAGTCISFNDLWLSRK